MYCQNKGLSHPWEGRSKVHSQIKGLSSHGKVGMCRQNKCSEIRGLSTHAKMGFV